MHFQKGRYSLTAINQSSPRDWQDLQKQVKKIFEECGLKAEIVKEIRTVRGSVKVDVYAIDSSNQPSITYLCECKYWKSSVPKSVVHAFRTVVGDYGANWGFIISSKGFQSGAFEAASKSNIQLLTWSQFQDLFVERWIEKYMIPQIQKETTALIEYTEPINSRIFRKADQLDDKSLQCFHKLRNNYADLAFLALLINTSEFRLFKFRSANLPLRKTLSKNELSKTSIPSEILDATCLREVTDCIIKHTRKGVAAFDQLFGGRA